MIQKRYLQGPIVKDLKEKMVFLGGPRQVGKTTLAKQLGDKCYHNPLYLNWDYYQDKETIRRGRFPTKTDLVIFDEVHKFSSWKNHIKGIYDKEREQLDILVTGSARLDLYRRGGDSLMGRYHYYRLHPFSLAELLHITPHTPIGKTPRCVAMTAHGRQLFSDLLAFGGFPEPFLKKDIASIQRWHNSRLDRLIKEDVRDVEYVRDLSALQILATILPTKVGSLLSLNSLREDFNVAHKTITLWMDILERFYYHFRIYPFTSKLIRSLRKESKLYLWDWSAIEDQAARLENLVAAHLLKFIHWWYDTQGYATELWYLRDTEKREVDFLVTINRKPWFAVEVKRTEQEPSPYLSYFAQRLRIPYCYQVVETPGVDVRQEGVRIISADQFLTSLV